MFWLSNNFERVAKYLSRGLLRVLSLTKDTSSAIDENHEN